MPSVTLTRYAREPDTGRHHFYFGKECLSYDSAEHARQSLAGFSNDLKQLAMRLILMRQPGLINPVVFVGRTINLDFSLASWGTVT